MEMFLISWFCKVYIIEGVMDGAMCWKVLDDEDDVKITA